MGIIGSIFQGVFGSNAANHAADVQAGAANNAAQLQADAANKALDFNKQQYGNSLNLLSPFYNTGVAANGRLGFLMGLNPGQGLPPGVVNPNAPQARTGGGVPGQGQGNPFVPGIGPVPSNASGNGSGFQPFQADGNMPNINSLRALQSNTAMGVPQFGPGTSNGQPNATQQFNMNNPITSPGTNGTQFQMNPPITSGANPAGGQTGQGGAAGMIQIGPDGQPTGVKPDVNPFPNGMPPGTINATTNQDGTGQVPQGGGGNFTVGPNTDPNPGERERNMFNPNDPNQGLSPDGSAPSGGTFGSLAQGWGKTFNSPTGVTEQNDPGYQFRLQQGQNALQNSAAARGGLLSGGTAKALTDYNQNAASGEYGNVYNRALQNYNTNYNTFTNDQTNLFNRLMALQSGGQVSANNLSASGITAAGNAANIGLTSAGQIGQNINNAGAAQASGYINSANAINGAVSSGTNSLASLLAMLGGR